MQLRLGLHCGPATAGVIGDTRFSYDVWGDAVNVAARMESHGVPDRIHVSEAFRAMTDGTFVFEVRGATQRECPATQYIRARRGPRRSETPMRRWLVFDEAMRVPIIPASGKNP
jgi:class 3 adenylate cyclase